MSGPLGSSQWMYNSGFYPTEIDQSLKFDGTSYLSRTPSVAGNRKTWTWSGWVKRSALGVTSYIASAYYATSNGRYNLIRFNSDDQLNVWTNAYSTVSATTQQNTTTAVFRDTSAWYHIVIAFDSTNATASSRLIMYVNGVSQEYTGSAIALNQDTFWNGSDSTHMIGEYNTTYFNGYQADTYLVDGTALDATSFGEFKSGVWIPKAYTGSYGTNGFHLTYQDDTVSEGFNTVTWNGNSSTQAISGVGFSPDLVWAKERSSTSGHTLLDTVRGVDLGLESNSTAAEENYPTDALTSFDADGFSLGSNGRINESSQTYVAWCWDAGDSTVSNTSGTIPSSVRANPAYGFSIVSYTGNTTDGATVGHGLGVAPNMFIVKDRDSDIRNWKVYHSSLGETLALDLNEPDSESAGPWSNTAPTSTVFTLGGGVAVNNTNDYIAYCFADIAGYSKFGSYTGTSASGNVITTGFKPAFVMIKNTTTSATNWVMQDNTRNTVNPVENYLKANDSDFERSFDNVDFLSNGFELTASSLTWNNTGNNYIYMAFADTRDLAFWRDQSGNGNDWQPTNLNYQDTVFDSPTNNYATWNPLSSTSTLSDGNLKSTGGAGTSLNAYATHSIKGEKYYAEFTVTAAVSTQHRVGIWSPDQTGSVGYRTDGQKINGTSSAYGASYGIGDIIGVYVNHSTTTIGFTKNGVDQGTFDYSSFITASQDAFISVQDGNAAQVFAGYINFGQSGFTYTPPAGFLALSTANLPEPSISPLYGASPQDHFNTVLYTGNSTDRNISVGFQPDFTWIKRRSTSKFHALMDSVRGFAVAGETPYMLVSNDTGVESSDQTNSFEAFTSDGFSLGTDGSGQRVNLASETYVAWNWKASNAASVLNEEGTIPSQVSANTTAGFSIVSYTGTGVNATVGHGLSIAPEMVIVKNRDTTNNWMVYFSELNQAAYLDLPNSFDASRAVSSFQGTPPTTSVINIGTAASTNGGTNGLIAYCFHSVEGYSKFGRYTGNGSLDGPFVYTGFRPAFILFKNTSISQSWVLYDTARDAYNAVSNYLLPDSPNGEGVLANADFLSNGFKLRWTSSINNSGNNFIYMAFAENPFKYANAR